jgi:hypothetical protein
VRAWANIIDIWEVRVSLIMLGVPITLVLGFFALIGASSIAMVFAYPEGNLQAFLLGAAGIIGISSGWVRVLVRSERFRRSRGLRWATTVGLGVGLFIAIWLALGLTQDPRPILPWFGASAAVVGVFLLGATIGARNAL